MSTSTGTSAAQPGTSRGRQRRSGLTRRRRFILSLQIGLASAVIVLLLWHWDLFVQLRLNLDNSFFVPHDTSGQVVIVAVDDASLNEYGRSLVDWPRDLHADLVEKLAGAGARVIAFDVLFADPTPEDDALADAIATVRTESDMRTRVVMPIVGAQRDEVDPDNAISFVHLIRPVESLVEAAAILGHTNVFEDADRTVRWLPTRITDGEQTWYAFSIATYLSYLRIPAAAASQVIRYEDGRLYVTDSRRIPVDGRGRMLINFFDEPASGAFETISYRAVLDGEVDMALFHDKIVLVGLMNHTGLTDLHFVPIGYGGRRMAGVEIHANALETLLQDAPLTAQGLTSQIVMIVALCVLSSLVYGLTAPRWTYTTAAAALLLVGWLIFNFTVFNLGRFKLNLFHALLSLVLPALITLVLYNVMELRRRQRAELLLDSMIDAASQRLSLDGMLPGIARDMSRITGSSRIAIWLWNDKTHRLQPAHPATDDPRAWQPDRDTVMDRALATGTIVHDQQTLAAPLIWQEERLGVMLAATRARLTSTQREMLNLFTWQTSALLSNAALHIATGELSELKTRMIRMASHDLKNPLGVVVGYCELLLDRRSAGLSDDQLRMISHIDQAAEQMLTIVNEILSLERARSGQRAEREFDLAETLRQAIKNHRPEIMQRNQALDVQIPETFPLLRGDPAQIREVFSNLISNASKYTPEEGRVTVRLMQQDDQARVEVEDTGYGISREAQTRLFQEFYRVRTEITQDIQGTGLGLSLVKAVIEGHGGEVGVTSAEGRGSIFWVSLPLPAQDAIPASPAAPEAPQASQASKTTGASPAAADTPTPDAS